MSAAFLLILLCVGPLATLGGDAGSEIPEIIRSNVPSRADQCLKRYPQSLGECTITGGNLYGTYLMYSCTRLWCIIPQDGRNVCVHVGRPDEYTKCSDTTYCVEGTCFDPRA